MRTFMQLKRFGRGAPSLLSAILLVSLMCGPVAARAESTISNIGGGSVTASQAERSNISIISSRAGDRRDEEYRTGRRSQRIVREYRDDDYVGFGGSSGRVSKLRIYGDGDVTIIAPRRYTVLDNRGWRDFDRVDSLGRPLCLVERSDGVFSRRELVTCDSIYGRHSRRGDDYIRGYRQGYRDAYGSDYYINRSDEFMCEVSTPSGMVFRGFGQDRYEARSRAVNSCAMTYPRWNCDHWSITCSK